MDVIELPHMSRSHDEGAKCPCGGYAKEVTPTKDETKKYGCGRSYACCNASFVCGLCGKRLVARLEAPEME